MTNMIQSLESRTLLSVTTATLAADKSTVVSDVKVLSTDLKKLATDESANNKAVATAFKGLPKVAQTLLKALESDESKSKSQLQKDSNALTRVSEKDASTAISVADTLLKKGNVKTVAALVKDLSSLDSVSVAPLATLQQLLGSNVLSIDAEAILAAYPTNTALTTAVSNSQTTVQGDLTAINAEAQQLATDLSTLATDLTTVKATNGTFPDMVGTFTGTATETKGASKGNNVDVSLVITTEDAAGNVSGTITDLTDGGDDLFTGTISLNGLFAGKAVNAGGGGKISISGNLIGATFTGKVASSKAAGTFELVKTS